MLAYLNCPYCTAQAIPAPRTDTMLLVGMGIQKFRCNGSKHEFYVNLSDVNGKEELDAHSVHGRCV